MMREEGEAKREEKQESLYTQNPFLQYPDLPPGLQGYLAKGSDTGKRVALDQAGSEAGLGGGL